jgi:hypothetical protein
MAESTFPESLADLRDERQLGTMSTELAVAVLRLMRRAGRLAEDRDEIADDLNAVAATAPVRGEDDRVFMAALDRADQEEACDA